MAGIVFKPSAEKVNSVVDQFKPPSEKKEAKKKRITNNIFLTEEQIDLIVTLRIHAFSFRQIGKAVGISHATVNNRIQSLKLKGRIDQGRMELLNKLSKGEE